MIAWRALLILSLALATSGCSEFHRSHESGNGFVPLFNGKDLDGWMYSSKQGRPSKVGGGYKVDAENGVLYCTERDGGNLITRDQFGDFAFRFEFKLTPNANNGVGIRMPSDGNAAYKGMEIQILDDTAPKYASLRPTQYCGSLYDVVPAERGHLKPVGEWNSEEIIARGRRITVKLNGATIVDKNLDEVTDAAVLTKHPGLAKPAGHIGFLGHGTRVEFRNIRIKTL